jgi:hypothetical protein|tara:strand:+ start:2557 stop:2724 length:168 start_codon:yes stop_codon:yes gene_type:complete
MVNIIEIFQLKNCTLFIEKVTFGAIKPLMYRQEYSKLAREVTDAKARQTINYFKR